jgi:hypothetical protein
MRFARRTVARRTGLQTQVREDRLDDRLFQDGRDTYETMAKKDAAPKIPNGCSAKGIQCVSLVDVLRAENIKL